MGKKFWWLNLLILSILNNCCGGVEEIDCIVSEWSSWGSCSKKCTNDGVKTMSRIVIRPQGTLFGKECPKDMLRSVSCGVTNNGCQQFCDPLTGRCECKLGLVLDKTTNKTCIDHDECALNFGRGPCNQRCTNTIGSYYCYCNPNFYLTEDKHTCRFNSSSDLCDTSIREYDNDGKCVCQDRSLEGLKCNKKKDKCKNLSCYSDSVCVLYDQSGMSCFSKNNLIPILHPVSSDNYKESDFKYIVELYITNILEGIKPKAPLFSEKPDHSFVQATSQNYFYVEAISNQQKVKTFTFVQYAVYNIESTLRKATRADVCSRLLGSDVHCLTAKECNIVKSEGRSCPFVYKTVAGKQIVSETTILWIPIVICLAILLLLTLIVILFVRRRKVKRNNLQIQFNNQNEEVTCLDDSALLNRNEPPPPYCQEDSNIQRMDDFNGSVFRDEPLNKNMDEPVYAAIQDHKLPAYHENYESMDCAKGKKGELVDLPSDTDDEEPRYVAPVPLLTPHENQGEAGCSSASEPHYAAPTNNQPIFADNTDEITI